MKFFLSILCCLYVGCLTAQERYDVVIDEIMADPSPAVRLPPYEWVELKNRSAFAIDLHNWRLGTGSAISGAFPGFILLPDSLVTICSTGAQPSLAVWGNAIAITSFPSLTNEGGLIFLKTSSGLTIHAVAYKDSWYGNDRKKEGGWSLEMIDTNRPCLGSDNWCASTSDTGGSPGHVNSVEGLAVDERPVMALSAYSVTDTSLELIFSGPVDSAIASNAANYTFDQGLQVTRATCQPPLFDRSLLTLSSPLKEKTIYTVFARNIVNCKGPIAADEKGIKTGLFSKARTGDWIINEILFDPGPGGFDYVEFHNKGSGILDASQLWIGTRNSGGVIMGKPISDSPYCIFPGDYIVVTEDATKLGVDYLVKEPHHVFQVASMPSFPDDAGDVIALDTQGAVLDEVRYNASWHFRLIQNPAGVSLERVDPNGASQDASNWHSAAATSGFGTPTAMNSQLREVAASNTQIEVTPAVFSPDNDGRDDVLTIQYHMQEPGWLATVTIFDAAGRPVRAVARNELLGISGKWHWDGLNDKEELLIPGIYIMYADLFNLAGKRSHIKKAFVLTRNRL